MSNAAYEKGRKREAKTRRWLETQGALDVGRYAGSHGLFDLCAVFPTHVTLVQVKSNRKMCGKQLEPYRALAALMEGDTRLIEVVWPDRAREPIVRDLTREGL